MRPRASSAQSPARWRRAAGAAWLPGLVLASWCAAPSWASAQPALDDVETAVQEFVAALGHADMPRLLACFSDDAVVFHPPSPPPRTFPARIEGLPEIERTFRVVFDQMRARSGRSQPPYQDIRPQDVVIQRFDAVAVVTFHLGTDAVRGRRTLVLHRTAAGWRVVHLHASTFETGPAGAPR